MELGFRSSPPLVCLTPASEKSSREGEKEASASKDEVGQEHKSKAKSRPRKRSRSRARARARALSSPPEDSVRVEVVESKNALDVKVQDSASLIREKDSTVVESSPVAGSVEEGSQLEEGEISGEEVEDLVQGSKESQNEMYVQEEEKSMWLTKHSKNFQRALRQHKLWEASGAVGKPPKSARLLDRVKRFDPGRLGSGPNICHHRSTDLSPNNRANSTLPTPSAASQLTTQPQSTSTQITNTTIVDIEPTQCTAESFQAEVVMSGPQHQTPIILLHTITFASIKQSQKRTRLLKRVRPEMRRRKTGRTEPVRPLTQRLMSLDTTFSIPPGRPRSLWSSKTELTATDSVSLGLSSSIDASRSAKLLATKPRTSFSQREGLHKRGPLKPLVHREIDDVDSLLPFESLEDGLIRREVSELEGTSRRSASGEYRRENGQSESAAERGGRSAARELRRNTAKNPICLTRASARVKLLLCTASAQAISAWTRRTPLSCESTRIKGRVDSLAVVVVTVVPITPAAWFQPFIIQRIDGELIRSPANRASGNSFEVVIAASGEERVIINLRGRKNLIHTTRPGRSGWVKLREHVIKPRVELSRVYPSRDELNRLLEHYPSLSQAARVSTQPQPSPTT
ncbi:LOW QUALITY PROTEIN: hypothetical protein HID58_076481 [Brassica napus]|uniref:Uncharacterized protein n=1 Tax=Brassica napus TaxID=3708 RepID=A0ABQ7YNU6_BRANA|nr:LOW QUALITY PROTEIN: hypothetical protein HID58_076481 [Brassica napus]